jgi:hypothetical protein
MKLYIFLRRLWAEMFQPPNGSGSSTGGLPPHFSGAARHSQPVGCPGWDCMPAFRTDCVASASTGIGAAHVISPAAKRQWHD